MVLTDEYQVDLTHQLTIDALAKILVRHGVQGSEMSIPGRADQCVEGPGLFKEIFNRGKGTDICLDIPGFGAYGDNLMLLLQGGSNFLSNGAGRADDDDFHTINVIEMQ